jgi:putative nucleotidyltransferase with HDIG domain
VPSTAPSARGLELSLAEELWFGDFSDESAEEAAASSMVAMAAKILGLRPFPAEAQEILRLSRDPLAHLGALSKRIEADPGFAARTLRLVNSAALITRTPCKSIHQAVVRTGMRTIGEMAVAAAMMALMSDDERSLELREHAMMVGGIARHLAVKLGLPGDDIYTCGLLHDMGKQLLVQDADDPERYEELLEAADGPDAVHIAEREALGYDHAVLAAHVLRAWNIPEPLPTVVAYHHQLQRAYDTSPEIGRMVAVLRLADQLAHGRMEPIEEILPRLVASPEGQYLGLEERKLARWWIELQVAAVESVAADDALENKPLSQRQLRCETCGAEGAPCCDCLKGYCGKHGDPKAGVCSDCDVDRTTDDLSALGAPRMRSKVIIIALALGVLAVGGALIYALLSR